MALEFGLERISGPKSCPMHPGPHPLTSQQSDNDCALCFLPLSTTRRVFSQGNLNLCSEESQDEGHLLGPKHQQDTDSISLQIWLLLHPLGFPRHRAVVWFLCILQLFIHQLAWKNPLMQINLTKPPNTNFSTLLNTGNHKCHEENFTFFIIASEGECDLPI